MRRVWRRGKPNAEAPLLLSVDSDGLPTRFDPPRRVQGTIHGLVCSAPDLHCEPWWRHIALGASRRADRDHNKVPTATISRNQQRQCRSDVHSRGQLTWEGRAVRYLSGAWPARRASVAHRSSRRSRDTGVSFAHVLESSMQLYDLSRRAQRRIWRGMMHKFVGG